MKSYDIAGLPGDGIGEITRQLWPLMAATFSVVLLITYVPWLSTWFLRWIASL